MTTIQEKSAYHHPVVDEWNDSLKGDYVWSNTNVGETVPGVMTPLTWSIMHYTFQPFSLVPGYHIMGNIGGHLYYNVSVFASALRLLRLNVREFAGEVGGYAQTGDRRRLVRRGGPLRHAGLLGDDCQRPAVHHTGRQAAR